MLKNWYLSRRRNFWITYGKDKATNDKWDGEASNTKSNNNHVIPFHYSFIICYIKTLLDHLLLPSLESGYKLFKTIYLMSHLSSFYILPFRHPRSIGKILCILAPNNNIVLDYLILGHNIGIKILEKEWNMLVFISLLLTVWWVNVEWNERSFSYLYRRKEVVAMST